MLILCVNIIIHTTIIYKFNFLLLNNQIKYIKKYMKNYQGNNMQNKTNY
jgi:hypothetical protein